MRTTSRFVSRRRFLILAAILALPLAACTVESGGSSPASQAAPSQAAPSPSSNVDPAPTLLDATPPPDVLGASEFWEYVGGTDMVESHDSLAAMIRASDLVLVGTVSGVRDGRRISIPETGETMFMADVLVDVATSLRGAPISDDNSGKVIVETNYGFAPNPNRLATLQASAPVGSRVVLFLVNKAADAVRRGAPDTPGATQEYYLLLRGDQAAIRDEAGIARVGRGGQSLPWLAALDGVPIEKVVDTIAAAASRLQ